MHSGSAQQLPLLVDAGADALPLAAGSAPICGFWSAGERLVEAGGRWLQANLWLHLDPSGEATVTVRLLDHDDARAARGSWHTDGRALVLQVGGRAIRAQFVVQGEVLYWAGELLLRLPADLPQQAIPTQLDDGTWLARALRSR